ncbi:unnamed protein product [Closterium sp. NIES-53]
MYLMTCTRPDLAYPLSLLTRYVAPVHRAWSSCLEDGLDLFSLVTLTPPGSSCEAEIYARAMAAQELRWLTYLLTDLGEAPRSPPVLYVDNKAMLALCQEHRLEHRTKHIALHYFLTRELQQRGQLRLAYVASQSNIADLALPFFPGLMTPCLPELLVPLPRSLPPPCTPCAEVRQSADPHSYLFPPTTAPLETLHLDVWCPSLVLGPRQERFFLIVVDDFSRFTTVFPLRRKADVPTILEPWLLT